MKVLLKYSKKVYYSQSVTCLATFFSSVNLLKQVQRSSNLKVMCEPHCEGGAEKIISSFDKDIIVKITILNC